MTTRVRGVEEKSFKVENDSCVFVFDFKYRGNEQLPGVSAYVLHEGINHAQL